MDAPEESQAAEPSAGKSDFAIVGQADKSQNSSLVAMHGGQVEVRSEGEGRGSELIVTLPLAHDGTAMRSDETPVAPKGIGTGCRVAIVDDNRDAADTLAMLLEGYGAEVQVAYDGPSAIELVQRWTPTLMFLDLGMPDMDGYAVARAIRQLPVGPAITLVAVTGWGHAAVGRSAAEAGFDRHLLKPASAEAITKLLAEHAACGG